METYIERLILEKDIKGLLYERAKLETIINETRESLRKALLHQEKYEKQIEYDEALIKYINDNIR